MVLHKVLEHNLCQNVMSFKKFFSAKLVQQKVHLLAQIASRPLQIVTNTIERFF